jgi:hypothetical protein
VTQARRRDGMVLMLTFENPGYNVTVEAFFSYFRVSDGLTDCYFQLPRANPAILKS